MLQPYIPICILTQELELPFWGLILYSIYKKKQIGLCVDGLMLKNLDNKYWKQYEKIIIYFFHFQEIIIWRIDSNYFLNVITYILNYF